MKRTRIVGATLAVSSLILSLTDSAMAAPVAVTSDSEPASITDLTVVSSVEGTSSTLILRFDEPITPDLVRKEAASLDVGADSLTLVNGHARAEGKAVTGQQTLEGRTITASTPTAVRPSSPGPRAAYHYCDRTYAYSDPDGRITWTHRCNNIRNDWTFNLGSALVGIISGNMHERGLTWARNGFSGARNAAHNVVPTYRLHGAMNPVYNEDYVTYNDEIDFRHHLGSGGEGSLLLSGSMTLSSVTGTCRPGSPC